MSKYKVIFKGELLNPDNASNTPDVMGPKLARFLNIPPEKSGILFSGKAFKIKGNLSQEKANALANKFAKIGLEVEILDEVEVFTDVTEQRKVTLPNLDRSGDSEASEENEGLEASIEHLPKRWHPTLVSLADIEKALPDTEQGSSVSLLAACNGQKQGGHTFSTLGLIFGIFYYFYLGLFKKAFLLMGVSVLCLVIVDSIIAAIGIELKLAYSWILPNILYAIFAKVDYFNTKVKGVKGYRSLRHCSGNVMATVFTLAAIWISVLSSFGIDELKELTTDEVTETSSLSENTPVQLASVPHDKEIPVEQLDEPRAQAEKQQSEPPLYTLTLSNGSTYFTSYAALEAHSQSNYGTKNGIQLHAVN